jgi:hypothetical protein
MSSAESRLEVDSSQRISELAACNVGRSPARQRAAMAKAAAVTKSEQSTEMRRRQGMEWSYGGRCMNSNLHRKYWGEIVFGFCNSEQAGEKILNNPSFDAL